MTKEEKLWFEKLTADREDSARTLEKRSMKGVKTSVVDKYTDQAHFIYELLQNADDANATSVRFVLDKNGLVFAHNGTRRFTVTDPDNEDEDSINGTLGDINSITSIANSNKNDDKNTIGKFGVGFKAVFQYTETPIIYDPKIAFRIERFIVPKLIEEDYKSRKSNETLFLFPFNHPKKTAKEAYEDISSKLKSLVFPILFLSKLQKIHFDIEGFKGTYSKDVKESRYFKDITAERVHLIQNNGEEKTVEDLWLFSREEDSNVYSVGFALDKHGKLKPIDKSAFFIREISYTLPATTAVLISLFFSISSNFTLSLGKISAITFISDKFSSVTSEICLMSLRFCANPAFCAVTNAHSFVSLVSMMICT